MGISRSKNGSGRVKFKRKIRPVPNGTPKLVGTRPITHPDTQLQGVIMMQRQLPHVQADIRQLIEPSVENMQTPLYIHPIMRPPPRPPYLADNNSRDFRPGLITDPKYRF